MTSRRIGRRPGDPEVTRQAILDAAREQFGSVGFDRATIRAIAELAGVDPALVIHHFRNKRQLFVTAHELPIDPSEIFASVSELPVCERGAALVAGYLGVFARPGSPPLSLLRAAATNEHAATMMREFLSKGLIEHGTDLVEGADAELRLALIGSHLVGVLFTRELLGIEPLAQADVETLARAIGPAIQHYIDGS